MTLSFKSISDKEVQRNPEWGLWVMEYCISYLFHTCFFLLNCGLMGWGNTCLGVFWSYEVQVEIVSCFIDTLFINYSRGNRNIIVPAKYLEHSGRGTKTSCRDVASSGMFPVLLCPVCPNLKYFRAQTVNTLNSYQCNTKCICLVFIHITF